MELSKDEQAMIDHFFSEGYFCPPREVLDGAWGKQLVDGMVQKGALIPCYNDENLLLARELTKGHPQEDLYDAIADQAKTGIPMVVTLEEAVDITKN